MPARTSAGLGVAQAILLGLIHLYRHTLGYFIGGRCRFFPSCSAYGLQAIRQRGAWTGFKLTGARLLRCHPWHPGGLDPVPKAEVRQ